MLIKEFDRQFNNLVQKGYPEAADIPGHRLLGNIEPLREKISELVLPEVDLEKGQLPFVIVVTSDLLTIQRVHAACRAAW